MKNIAVSIVTMLLFVFAFSGCNTLSHVASDENNPELGVFINNAIDESMRNIRLSTFHKYEGVGYLGGCKTCARSLTGRKMDNAGMRADDIINARFKNVYAIDHGVAKRYGSRSTHPFEVSRIVTYYVGDYNTYFDVVWLWSTLSQRREFYIKYTGNFIYGRENLDVYLNGTPTADAVAKMEKNEKLDKVLAKHIANGNEIGKARAQKEYQERKKHNAAIMTNALQKGANDLQADMDATQQNLDNIVAAGYQNNGATSSSSSSSSNSSSSIGLEATSNSGDNYRCLCCSMSIIDNNSPLARTASEINERLSKELERAEEIRKCILEKEKPSAQRDKAIEQLDEEIAKRKRLAEKAIQDLNASQPKGHKSGAQAMQM